MKKFVKWSLIVGCVGFGAWTVWNLWATSRLESVVTDLRGRGLPTTIAELEHGLPPYDSEPAETENAAPVLEAAFALAKSIEPLPEWDPGDGPESLEDLRGGLPRFEKVFDLLYQAAERPRCRFDLRWRDGYRMLLAHVAESRDLARLLRSRAMLRSADGETDGAIEDVRVLFSLARSLREEPILISQLVRIAVVEMGLEALETILPRCESAVAALERTSPDLATGSMARAFKGELVMSLSVATNPDMWDALADVDSTFDSAFTGVAGPYLTADLAYMAGLLGRCVELVGKPYPAVLALIDNLNQDADSKGGVLTKILLPSVSSTFRSEARHASRVALVELGAKCIDYRKEHGKYPASLGDLKDVQPDPLTGRPFVLEARGEGIVLRSEAHEEESSREIEWELL